MINFNQLRTFYHAARNQSFTKAAHNLFITQPAVTAQIKAFEDHCSLKLFKKKGRNICLTDQGHELYHKARRIFEYEQELENLIDELKNIKRGDLRLGSTKAYARYLMPVLLSSFHREYPQVRIHLDEGSSLTMTNSLVDCKNEVAVIARAVDNPEVDFIPFSQEELVLITATNHPFVGRVSISFAEVANEPVIMKEIGSGTRKLVNELFARNHIKPNMLMETSNTEFIKQLVQRGEGIAFLVRAAVAQELSENKLAAVAIGGQKIFLDVSVAHLKSQPLSPPARAFVRSLKRLRSEDQPVQGIGALMGRILAQPWEQGKI